MVKSRKIGYRKGGNMRLSSLVTEYRLRDTLNYLATQLLILQYEIKATKLLDTRDISHQSK